MKRLALLFTLVYFMFFESLGCDCKYISKQEEYKSSDLIFVGEISTVEKDRFYVSMIESLKGDKTDTLMSVFVDNCSVYPQQGETWLLYSTIDDGVRYVSKCGWSRSFQHPFQIGSGNMPLPPSPGTDASLMFMIDNTSKNKALSELYFDISTMRNERLKASIDEIRTKIESESKYDLSSIESTLRWILIIVALSLLISVIALVRKK